MNQPYILNSHIQCVYNVSFPLLLQIPLTGKAGWTWWLGAIPFQLAAPIPCDIVAFGNAPQSLVAPLAGFAIVVNQMMAPCFLPESLTKMDIISSLVIVVGCVATTAFGSHNSATYDLRDTEKRRRVLV